MTERWHVFPAEQPGHIMSYGCWCGPKRDEEDERGIIHNADEPYDGPWAVVEEADDE